jgi:hypothetical protein
VHLTEGEDFSGPQLARAAVVLSRRKFLHISYAESYLSMECDDVVYTPHAQSAVFVIGFTWEYRRAIPHVIHSW